MNLPCSFGHRKPRNPKAPSSKPHGQAVLAAGCLSLDIDIDADVEVDIGSYFGCFNWASKSV